MDFYEKMKSEIIPVKMVMVDVLIYRTKRGDNTVFYCFPIMKDLSDGRLYVSFYKYSYGSYLYRCFEKMLPGQEFKVIINSNSGREINFGDVANCYINRKLGTLSSNGKSIYIDNHDYKYDGMTKDANLLGIGFSSSLLMNVTNENFLCDVDNIILFEGIIDFDI